MKLTLGYFYPRELNLYGDTGNVEILISRAKARGAEVAVEEITSVTKLSSDAMRRIDLVFMGGGPDSGQQQMYRDLLEDKAPHLREHIEGGKVGLFICGAYQLMGHYYRSADGSELKGLSILDLYTQHFGHAQKRCVGNIVCALPEDLLTSPAFANCNLTGSHIVGFENHGGRTFLGKGTLPFAKVRRGFGNNGQDKTEGAHYKNTIGTYLHGPLLAKNPHIADYLIARALGVEKLTNLDDTIINNAHAALVKRFG